MGAVVLTLNYDTLLEWALRRVIVGGGGPLDLRAALGIELQSIPGYLGVPETRTVVLLKLHGSIDWFYSGSDMYFGEPIYDHPLPGKVPLILPPVASKSLYFNNELIRGQWTLAAEALARAKRIFCIGYSLPTTDLTVRFLLHASRSKFIGEPRSVPVYIVDREARRLEHYKGHLPFWLTAENEFCGGDDCIPRLVSQLESELVTTPPKVNAEESADAYCSEIVSAGITPGDTLQTIQREDVRSVVIELFDWHGIVVRDDDGVACRIPWACFDSALRRISQENATRCHIHRLSKSLERDYPSRYVTGVVVSLLERLGRQRSRGMEPSLPSSYVELSTDPTPNREM